MTKKWSSTKSMDGQTKRQASKKKRRQQKVITKADIAAFREAMFAADMASVRAGRRRVRALKDKT